MKKFALLAFALLFVASSAQAQDFPIFVGKGDVQLALGFNNQQIQNAEISFALVTTSESTWTCDRYEGPQTQERSNTTTTSGVVSYSERVRNQITGFWLTGFSGEVVNENEGPAVGSCPTGWTAINLDTVGGGDGVIKVNGVEL
jgi:hypothetical protein